MNRLKKNTNNLLPTIFYIGLVFFVFLFASIEKKGNLNIPKFSINLFIDINTTTQAVTPPPTDLPICASFTDENHIIISTSFTIDYSISLKNDNEFSFAHKKHLIIKPLFTKVVRRLTFPDTESVDFIAIC